MGQSFGITPLKESFTAATRQFSSPNDPNGFSGTTAAFVSAKHHESGNDRTG
jgi:hypothetical protein